MDAPQHFVLQAEAMLLFLAACATGGLAFWNAWFKHNGYRSARTLVGVTCLLLGLTYLYSFFSAMDLSDFTVISRLLVLMMLFGWMGREMRDV